MHKKFKKFKNLNNLYSTSKEKAVDGDVMCNGRYTYEMVVHDGIMCINMNYVID